MEPHSFAGAAPATDKRDADNPSQLEERSAHKKAPSTEQLGVDDRLTSCSQRQPKGSNNAVLSNKESHCRQKPWCAKETDHTVANVKAGDWLHVDDLGEETLLIHGGEDPEPSTGAILPPIFHSTTFVQDSVADYLKKGFSYTRTANPTVATLEKKIATMEGGKFACCFSSGMAATTTVLSTFLKPGDHCVMPNCSYGGTNRCARLHFSKYGINFEFVDFRDVALVEKAIRPKQTKLVFSETPSNPTLHITDVAAVSAVCKRYCIPHVCDSTFATPYIMKPLELGADMTLQSTTKYYDGHNWAVGGAVICTSKDIYEALFFHRNVLGNIMNPYTASLMLTTAKTLSIRIQRQSENAMKIAEYLRAHPKVIGVAYPGLDSFPQYELAKKQHKNIHGNMVGFEVKGGTEAGIRLMDSVPRPWSLCENLGAVQSIITCPAVFTHGAMQREDRLKVGITDGYIRLSVGLEDVDDLIEALDYGLSKV